MKTEEEEKAELLNIQITKKIFNFFSNMFASSWLVGADFEGIKGAREVWVRSMRGLTEKQVEYAIERIRFGKSEFIKFAPNPIEFRLLCLEMPEAPVNAVKFLEIIMSDEKRAEFQQNLRQLTKVLKIEAIQEKRKRMSKLRSNEASNKSYRKSIRQAEEELAAMKRSD